MNLAFAVATGIVAVSVLLGIVGIVRAADDASRAVISDLIFFCAIAVFILTASLAGSAVVFDVALIASMLGILATLALAFMLTRGRR